MGGDNVCDAEFDPAAAPVSAGADVPEQPARRLPRAANGGAHRHRAAQNPQRENVQNRGPLHPHTSTMRES